MHRVSPSTSPSQFRRIFIIMVLSGLALLCPRQAISQSLNHFVPQTRQSDLIENMYVKGLNYLVQCQNPDGSFDGSRTGEPTAIAAFSVMAALAHGDDPNVGPYSEMIRKCINHILSSQDQSSGYITKNMYAHGFSTLALAEAYGMVKDERIGPALESAVNLILKAQNQNRSRGWRYQPNATDADSSIVGCQLVALLAARNAGIGVPDKAIEDGLKYMRTCQKADNGGFSYMPTYSESRVTLTSIGSLVIALNKSKEDDATYQKAFKFLSKNINHRESTYPFYFEYYMSQAIFHSDDNAWEKWNSKNIRNMKNFQAPDGAWDFQGAPAYSTSLALLSLALNYRFLPIYEK